MSAPGWRKPLSSQPVKEKIPNKHNFSSSTNWISAFINNSNKISKSTNQNNSCTIYAYFGISPDGLSPWGGSYQWEPFNLAGTSCLLVAWRCTEAWPLIWWQPYWNKSFVCWLQDHWLLESSAVRSLQGYLFYGICCSGRNIVWGSEFKEI